MKIKSLLPQRILHGSGLQWAMLLPGLLTYWRTGKTSDRAYHNMINLFCKTRGWSNDFLHSLVKTFRRPYKLPPAEGVLGKLSPQDVESVTQKIQDNGYYVFPRRLSPELCERLRRHALTMPTQPMGLPGQMQPLCIYDPAQPRAPKHSLPESGLLANQDVQALMSDFSLLAVVQSYLGCQPVLDILTMWWTTAFLKEASSEVAQLYHFDMDRIKWLKIFIYLTDVTSDNGPHCFIRGSHKRKGQPEELLHKGYARITDEEMARYYPRESFVEFTGPQGTIIAEDTRGFHKGKKVDKGNRLVLELEYCNCLFGAAYDRLALPKDLSPAARQLGAVYPRILSKYERRAA